MFSRQKRNNTIYVALNIYVVLTTKRFKHTTTEFCSATRP